MLSPNYPADFPTVALGVIADKLRGKGVANATALHAAWIVVGWGAGNFAPDNSQPNIVGANLDDEAAQAQYVEEILGQRLAGAGPTPAQGVIPFLLLVRIALKLISTLI